MMYRANTIQASLSAGIYLMMDVNMVQDASKLQMLAAAYIRKRQPNAQTSDIATAVEELHERIERGELTFDAVVRRLELEIGKGRANTPTAFGDMARAVRDLDGGRLSEPERRFVVDMCRRGFSYSPTDRQTTYLRNLYIRLARRAA